MGEQNIELTKDDEKVLNEVWKEIAKAHGKGKEWEKREEGEA